MSRMMFASLMVVCGLAFASPHVAMAVDEAPASVVTEATSDGTPEKVAEEHEKVATPITEKWVLEDSTNKWVPAADRGLDERFRYRIDGTMQGDMADYETYEWWLVDTLPAGTDLDESSLSVVLVADGKEKDVKDLLSISYEGRVLKIGTPDILTALEGITPDDVIRVEYEATCNADFKIGVSDPNDNFCHIEHTTPITGKGTVSSPESRARAVSWMLGVTKHEQGNASKVLSGATFELADESGKKLATVTTDAKGQASVVGLDSGSYVLTETKAPSGYAKADPVRFEIKPEWDGIELKSLGVVAKGVDAKSEASEGTVTLVVADVKESGKTTHGSGTGKTSVVSAGVLPSTGDMRLDAILYGLAGVGLVLLGIGLWVRRDDKGKEHTPRV